MFANLKLHSMARGYYWAKSNKPGKPTEAEKQQVTDAFAPLIAELKASLPPLQEPQKTNQCVDLQAGWRGSYFTLKGIYKCPPGGTFVVDGFEMGVARLTYKGKDQFDLAYLRHDDKWFVMAHSISLAQAIESIKNDSWFDIF